MQNKAVYEDLHFLRKEALKKWNEAFEQANNGNIDRKRLADAIENLNRIDRQIIDEGYVEIFDL